MEVQNFRNLEARLESREEGLQAEHAFHNLNFLSTERGILQFPLQFENITKQKCEAGESLCTCRVHELTPQTPHWWLDNWICVTNTIISVQFWNQFSIGGDVGLMQKSCCLCEGQGGGWWQGLTILSWSWGCLKVSVVSNSHERCCSHASQRV